MINYDNSEKNRTRFFKALEQLSFSLGCISRSCKAMADWSDIENENRDKTIGSMMEKIQEFMEEFKVKSEDVLKMINFPTYYDEEYCFTRKETEWFRRVYKDSCMFFRWLVNNKEKNIEHFGISLNSDLWFSCPPLKRMGDLCLEIANSISRNELFFNKIDEIPNKIERIQEFRTNFYAILDELEKCSELIFHEKEFYKRAYTLKGPQDIDETE